jgi:hypothetical protein
MTTLLDKHPGARQYVAQLHIFGANRAEICASLGTKYDIAAPTPRILTTWLNKDPDLKRMIAELAAIKADMSPDDPTLPDLPAPVNKTLVDTVLFTFCDEHPAFADLLYRETEPSPESAESTAPTPGAEWWRETAQDAAAPTGGDINDDVLAVLSADYDTAEDFENACLERLGDDYDPHAAPLPAPAGFYGSDDA